MAIEFNPILDICADIHQSGLWTPATARYSANTGAGSDHQFNPLQWRVWA